MMAQTAFVSTYLPTYLPTYLQATNARIIKLFVVAIVHILE